MTAPHAVALQILHDGDRVGGTVLTINHETQANSLDLLFIAVRKHRKGLGKAAWSAIEPLFPDTRSWETATPYFEKRNIHFYVNAADSTLSSIVTSGIRILTCRKRRTCQTTVTWFGSGSGCGGVRMRVTKIGESLEEFDEQQISA